MRIEHKLSFEGRSLWLNLLFSCLNISGLIMVVLGAHDAFQSHFFLLSFIGFNLIAISAAMLLIFHGRVMMTSFSRIILGTIFIFSGLLKVNDPIGFSYKLQEFLKDDALAYRLKTLFNNPSFTLESWLDNAFGIAIFICVIEIILGIFLILGEKLKIVTILTVIMLSFFSFLTWHSSSCKVDAKFKDRNTYSIESHFAKEFLKNKINFKNIKLIEKNNYSIVVDEWKHVNCVSDCGCFGEAMNHVLGRSLTAKESFLKDIILLFFSFWLLFSMKRTLPINAINNFRFIVISCLIITALSILFQWYLPIGLSIILFVASVWMKREGGIVFGNWFGMGLILILINALILIYVVRFDVLKDFRPYAIGQNLLKNTKNGHEGKITTILKYKNKYNGEILVYNSPSSEYSRSMIWKNDSWKLLKMTNKVLKMPIAASISEQFNPSIPIEQIGSAEKQLAFVRDFLLKNKTKTYQIIDVKSNKIFEIPELDYTIADFPDSLYRIKSEVFVENNTISELSIRDYIFSAKELFVLVVQDLEHANWSTLNEIKMIVKQCKRDKKDFLMLTSSSFDEINEFRNKYNFHVATFINDITELKSISRSNPTLMRLKKGFVTHKYPFRSIPKYNEIY